MSRSQVADIWPATPAQEGLLYHALLNPDSPDVYLVQTRFEVTGPVDVAALRAAVMALPERHPNLRVCFRHKGLDHPVQVVPRQVQVPWTEVDLSGQDGPAAEAELRRLLDADRDRRFDVTRPPLLRCTLVRHGVERAELILTLHHLLVDGWSMPILARDLAELYAGRGAHLPPVADYRNYLSWLRGQDVTAAHEAWRHGLAGVARPTLVARDAGPRGTVVPRTVELELSSRLTAALRRRARDAAVTVNTLAQAAWALVLSRMTGTDDVVFGVVVSGRHPDVAHVQDMVGLLINTVPARVRMRPGERLCELLRWLQDEQLRLIPFHHVRLAEVQRLAGVGELFDTVLAFENFPQGADPSDADGGLRLLETQDATHYPLTVTMLAAERMWLRIIYHPGCFTAPMAELVAGRLVRVLEVLADDLDRRVGEVDVLPARERSRLLVAWNDTARPPVGLSVPAQFAVQVSRAPHAVAVESTDLTLSYAELNDRADRLAGQLRAAGVGAEIPVALLMARSAHLVIAQLAVLKAGGYYLPLDPAQPRARLTWLIRDARARIVLADDAPDWLPDGVRVLTVTDTGEVPPAVTQSSCDAAAYVMYTSGSTGTPKGVVTSHRNVVELATDRRFTSSAHRRLLLHSPHTFDAATYELWVPLLNGGTVVVAPPGPLDPNSLEKVLTQGRISALWLTAELFRTVAELVPEALAGLREVWAGGDVLAPDAVRRLGRSCPATTVVNGYGPTETTTFATSHRVRRPLDGGSVPIGRPLDNTCAYVLDSRLRPAPVGVVGELYLAGTGLARGYLNQPAITAERFVAAPYSSRPGERMYRTGDLARWTDDGELEFVGRADAQVKIRGYRVEPAEVEATLESCPGVLRAVVVTRSAAESDIHLAAYLVLAPDGDVAAVRRHAAQQLPRQMLPASYEPIEALPLTPHGKVDRSALPQLPARVGRPPAALPRSPLEATLCERFAEVLRVPAVGREDNFFEAGGHSLLAMRLASAVESALGTPVPITALYDTPTPAALAARLRAGLPDHGLAPLLTLRAGGDGTPLFLLPPGMGLGWAYTALLPHLASGRPLYALQSTGFSGDGSLPAGIGEIADDFLARIRAVQPDGPYLLFGRSFGGLLAYEIAARLRRAGQQVGPLAVLDAVPAAPDEPPPPLSEEILEQEALRLLLHNWGPVADRRPGPLDRERVFAAVCGQDGPLHGASEDLLANLVRVCAHHVRLAATYRPSAYDGRVLFFSAAAEPDGPTSQDKVAAWRQAATDVCLYDIDCSHSRMLQPEPAAEIAAILDPILRSVDADR